ncbi:hypothetical protein LSUB1_G002034 [Lachnellula subtilissima]|uniref:Uncharacterized protein n=1 Tax=Lachnellula subtilissima TaxID=602034 RepID=A0A8H8RYU3_9HELO|nr:hypothetical protein LSUB1_G002034 [Lachnellula subtilissima]
MADIQNIDFIAMLNLPVAYILLPAVLILVGFFAKGNIWPAVLAGGKPVLPPTKGEVMTFKEYQSGQSMGDVIPLKDFDWKTEEPRKIYKFSPKYFLTMGLQNTNINFITHVDRQYQERCKARHEILRTHPNALACRPGAEAMVDELYAYLVNDYLPHRYPTIFQFQSQSGAPTHLLNNVTTDVLPLTPPQDRIETLRLLAVNVDEDFLMLLPSSDGDGYSLESVIWCYPVGFDAGDKVGLKLRDAHKPVPAYKEVMQSSMDRYFGKLAVGKVIYRVNWAVATNDNLCEDGEYHLYEGQEASDTEVDISKCFVRCELQTLFALPKSGGRILSVHLYLYPLQQIKDDGLQEQMIEAIDGLKQGNAPGFWRYKRAPVWHDKVKEFLRS